MKKSVFILSLIAMLAITISQTSCTGDGICKNGNGSIQTDTVSLSSFEGIVLEKSATVIVTQGSSQEITVTGDENVLEALDFRVENGQLILDLTGCFFSYDLDVFITVPDTQSISRLVVSGSGEILVQDSLALAKDFEAVVSGSGEIRMTAANEISYANILISGSGEMTLDFNADSTTSKISGSGDLFLSGSSISHDMKITGSGDLEAFDFLTENTDIKVSGSGNADVWVEGGVLSAKITGSGDVRYTGVPTAVNSEITGSGSLIKK
jgi:hypothetical protein